MNNEVWEMSLVTRPVHFIPGETPDTYSMGSCESQSRPGRCGVDKNSLAPAGF
jgi:hypothetical protein